jgi:hypothetical protein
MAVHPVLTSAQRHYILSLMKPVVELLTNYRHQLSQVAVGPASSLAGTEVKVIEGFLVVASAIVECMELFRIVESGQLTSGSRGAATITEIDLLNGLDSLLLRDVVLSAGVGNDYLVNFLSGREGIDASVLRKHCPIIFPKSL